MKILSRYVSVLLLTVILISCETLMIEKDGSGPVDNFNLVWNDLDRNYPFFILKDINWDSIYSVFRPKIYETTTDQELYNILSEMTLHLKDGHLSIYSPFGVSNYNANRQPVNSSVNAKLYLQNIQNPNPEIFFGDIVNTSIGYINISTFLGNLSDFEIIDNIITRFQDKEGIIIDVRSNHGGAGINGRAVAARFVKEKSKYAYHRFRKGEEWDNFTPWYPLYIEPKGERQFLKPVAVLINGESVSEAEDFTLMMKIRPETIILGSLSFGATGTPMYKDLYNGWLYSVPTWMLVDTAYNSYEGTGIPPDIETYISKHDSINKIDRIIEKAVETLIEMKISN